MTKQVENFKRDPFDMKWSDLTTIERFDRIAAFITAPVLILIAIPFALVYDAYRYFTDKK